MMRRAGGERVFVDCDERQISGDERRFRSGAREDRAALIKRCALGKAKRQTKQTDIPWPTSVAAEEFRQGQFKGWIKGTT
jgi:hypothetical protein